MKNSQIKCLETISYFDFVMLSHAYNSSFDKGVFVKSFVVDKIRNSTVEYTIRTTTLF